MVSVVKSPRYTNATTGSVANTINKSGKGYRLCDEK
jgi:hypothetical protein